MELTFRPAQKQDVEAAIPLIYSAGPAAFEYGFSLRGYDVKEFLHYAFEDGRGFFGWKNHTVAIHNNEVVGIGAFYNGTEYHRLSVELILQLFHYYSLLALVGVVRHSLQLKNTMPPPSRHTHYVANLGIRSDMRSRGIGAALIHYQQQVAQELGRSIYALDVSTENPRAQALYEKQGFKVKREQYFPDRNVPGLDSRRMELRLEAIQ